MRVQPARIALGAVGLAVGVLSVFELREATMTTHSPVHPTSRLDVVVSARTRGGERDQSLQEMVEALLLSCRLEVAADVVGPTRDEGNGRFRVALEPSLDKSNRRQLRGCIEDWTIDQLLVDIVTFEPSR